MLDEEWILLEAPGEQSGRVELQKLRTRIQELEFELKATKAGNNEASSSRTTLSVVEQNLADVFRKIVEGDDSEAAAERAAYWDQQLRTHPEYIARTHRLTCEWAVAQEQVCREAREEQVQHVPVDIAFCTVETLVGRGVCRRLAQRLKKRRALWFVHMDSEDIRKMHITDLRGLYSTEKLDLIELRSVWASLPLDFADDKKTEWRDFVCAQMKRLVDSGETARNGAYMT